MLELFFSVFQSEPSKARRGETLYLHLIGDRRLSLGPLSRVGASRGGVAFSVCPAPGRTRLINMALNEQGAIQYRGVWFPTWFGSAEVFTDPEEVPEIPRMYHAVAAR